MGANNISLPEPLLAEIQSAAQAENRSVDEVLQEALRQYLDDRSWTKILGYGQRRAKELGLTEADNIEVRGPLVKSLQYQCQGKVEMSPRWQSRNVPFCLRLCETHVILPVPVKRRRALVATNPIKE